MNEISNLEDKNVFKYYFEFEKENLTKEKLEEHKCLMIKCGTFLYSKAVSQFACVLGLTATPNVLEYERNLDRLSIFNKITIIPPIFGPKTLSFDRNSDITIANVENYFPLIAKEVNSRLIGTTQNSERPVLVVFKSQDKMIEFYNSNALSEIRDEVAIITDDMSQQEQDSIINLATSPGQITILTRKLCRGVDFVYEDPNLSRNGGMHVLQTFFSKELYEEIQIRGRTARQGDAGSYSLIILDSELEKINFSAQDIHYLTKETKSVKTKYDLLNEKRNTFLKNKYKNLINLLKETAIENRSSKNIVSIINSRDISSLKKFLIDDNKYIENSGNDSLKKNGNPF